MGSPTFRLAGPSLYKIKFSSTFFKRWQFPKTASLVERRSARNASIVRRLLEGEGNPCKQDFLRGPFCKRKRAQETAGLHHPRQPSGGRLPCCQQDLFKRRSSAAAGETPISSFFIKSFPHNRPVQDGKNSGTVSDVCQKKWRAMRAPFG